ncbi:hydrophobin-251 [Pholiota molesta]|nr:hydrophobin-251 [Pholiota molesta]
MFSKLAFFTVAAMAVFVVGSPDGGISNSCNTGKVQCCNSLQQANSPQYSGFLALLGVAAGDITGQLGVNCSPISAIAVGGGSSCTTQPVCCSNNNFNGVIAIGCGPVNIA